MTVPEFAIVISVLSLLVAGWSATIAALARRDAAEARRAADAAAAPQLTLTFDPRRRTLFLRNLGSRPAQKVEVRVTDLYTAQR